MRISPDSIFLNITSHPKKIFLAGIIFIGVMLSFLPNITTDPRAESFLPKDSPALLYRDKVEDIFGLTDPMVIAIHSQNTHGVFTPETLELVKWITDQVASFPEINHDRVISLATEDNIYGNDEGMVVTPFFEEAPTSQYQANNIRQAVMDIPLYTGTLVSRSGNMTLVAMEIPDEWQAPKVYKKLLNLVDTAPIKNNETLHVAGDGAVSGYLVTYINGDMARLVPISVVVITLMCFFALRTLAGVMIPGVVIMAAASSALGTMAAFGDPIYVITTSMPILLVGIAVADSLHILSEYYEQHAHNTEFSQQKLVVIALNRMWRPVLLTTITSMIGFLGVYASSYMPPMQSFGIYSMIGLGIAGVFSLVVLPAMLMFFKPTNSLAFQRTRKLEKHDIFATFMANVGKIVIEHPIKILMLGASITLAGLWGALHLKIDESWVENFQSSEPIFIADVAINQSMDGTNNLDIVIETPANEDLFKPENLNKIEALQAYIETLPYVGGTTSIVDYLKQMNKSLNGNAEDAYLLPNSNTLISQYFLLYSASGDPTDFEEEIDYDYRLALVRAQLNTGKFQQTRTVVEPLQHYLQEHFNSEAINGSLSGRVYVDYEWLSSLLGTHYKSVIFALALVWVISCISFRSIYGGTLTLVPVFLSTLAVYALMGAANINLAVGTSMSAAIALGIGIDFAIHTLDRVKLLIQNSNHTVDQALAAIYPSTGRALLFNFFAVFLGFGLLAFSHVPPLSKMGMLIAFAVMISFISSLTVLPALIKITKPSFLLKQHQPYSINKSLANDYE